MNSYQNHTDSQLMAALHLGDEKAFDAIYDRYVKMLYNFAQKNLPKEECHEILQEVFSTLWAKRENLGHVNEQLKSYLYKMVKNRIVRHFEHEKVKQKYADHFKAFEIIYDNSLEHEHTAEVMQEKLNRSMEELPDRCQQVVKLRLSENLSNGDIALRMGIDKSTVKRYMTYAMNFFREKHSSLYKVK